MRLFRLNSITRPAAVWLVVLSCLVAVTASAADKTYVVKRGDTLTGIAKANGLSVSALAERNGLSRNHHVKTGQRLVIPGPAAAPSSGGIYLVKRGDTLTDIARAQGVSLPDLAEANGVSTRHMVRVGERLKIPGVAASSAASAAATPSAGAMPSSITSAIANAPVATGRWKYIVIHHSGTTEGSVKGMDNYHRQVRHMENGLAYHFVIGNGNGMGNGEIAVGNRWRKQLDGGHLASLAQNKVAIGICLVGNYDRTPPTSAQLKSLNALVRSLMTRCNISASNVKTHQQINVIGTKCPGSKFPTKSFLAGLKS